MNTRFVVIESGGGYDSAVMSYLNVPQDLNLAEAEKSYRRWYADEYTPALRAANKRPYQTRQHPRYLQFAEWVKETYGATDAEVEVYSEL